MRHIFLESPQLLGSRNSGRGMFRGLKASGRIEKGSTIEKWKEKDLSTCVLSGDPECALEKGTVGKSVLRGTFLCRPMTYLLPICVVKSLTA